MNEEAIITEFDNMIQDEHDQLLKATLPYVHPSGQRILSFYVKFKELMNTFKLFKEEENTLSACSSGKKNLSPMEMLSDIRKFCPAKDREQIDTLLNFINMYTLYNKYSQAFNNNDKQEDSFSQLSNLLSPEQKSMLEGLMSKMS